MTDSDCAEAFLPSYVPIVERRKETPFTPEGLAQAATAGRAQDAHAGTGGLTGPSPRSAGIPPTPFLSRRRTLA